MLDHLFVYGTLRRGADSPMARRLRTATRYLGAAHAQGMLYRVASYPGFVPGAGGRVAGDLLLLEEAEATLAWLDDYEECSPHFPPPHEYRRIRLIVIAPDGPVEAWAYVYDRSVAGLSPIESGDFLAQADRH
ncbi:gamma-glutamylcyclotransferase (GGCT)/AIG2-like uncharacterized protein YtfP [Sphingobium sp. OAS761]|uniref:gamma-glutamylcyclotransferase family protein n=1 Tax=Sphingobium sp. OAS761 TaxID=2817901 RepID=UPI0020A1EE6A|nr:gamma-glutamylcyclotransferase family protein [Sphingobium sp. OAS761]MCP1472071.1 gamma-glutamylcyclotransferase (GGCT)/AIG2-like uncharacterized protein YtfP [Sphingobium sp. OAS761]